MATYFYDLGKLPNPDKIIMKLLVAERVIEYARKAIPHGAGNQRENIAASSYLAYFLTMPGYYWQKQPGEFNAKGSALRTANITRYFGAGNCDLQAAVVYTMLRCTPHFEPGMLHESISKCAHASIHHAFSVIGKQTDPADQVVVVDPWPVKPQPVLLSHHFCGNMGNPDDNLKWFVTKVADKVMPHDMRLRKHDGLLDALGGQAYKKQVEDQAADAKSQKWLRREMRKKKKNPLHLWNHTLTVNQKSLHADRVIYTVRKKWASALATDKCKACSTNFNLLRSGHHHCRRCGEVFCEKCSGYQNTVALPAQEPKGALLAVSAGPVRVCQVCNHLINGIEADTSSYQGGYVPR